MSQAQDEMPESVIGADATLLRSLLKLASIISRPMEIGVARHFDLSTNELRVLMAIGGEGPLAGHDIAEMMAIPPMNVSRALAILAERGWTEPVADPNNRRRRPVQLSAKGWDAYRGMLPDMREIANYLCGALSKTERTTFDRLQNRLIERIESWQPGGEN